MQAAERWNVAMRVTMFATHQFGHAWRSSRVVAMLKKKTRCEFRGRIVVKVWGKAGQRASRTARGKRPQPHHACNPGPSPPRPGQTVTPRHCPPHRAGRGACVEGPRGLTRQRAAGSDLGCCAGELLPSDSSSNAVTSAGERQMDGGGPLVGEHAQADGWPSRVRVRVCVLRERARRSPSWSTAGAGPSASGPRFPAPLPRAWHGGQGQGGQPLP